MDQLTRALERARSEKLEPRDAAAHARDGADERDEVVAGAADAAMRGLKVHELDSDLLESARILAPGAGGPYSAGYKMLRTQTLRRLDQLGANTLAIVSATERAGKTLTAINLAIAVAADRDRSVLLVDFDLRNPVIHERLGLEPDVGVEQCLQEGRPLQEAMLRLDGYERLVILPAREAVDNSSELLAEQRTVDAISRLRLEDPRRIVIFDLPPLLQADDALVAARYIQAGLLVVHEGRTRRADVTRSIQLLRDLPIVGTVLNGSREPSAAPY